MRAHRPDLSKTQGNAAHRQGRWACPMLLPQLEVVHRRERAPVNLDIDEGEDLRNVALSTNRAANTYAPTAQTATMILKPAVCCPAPSHASRAAAWSKHID